jgi:hypothetical protein
VIATAILVGAQYYYIVKYEEHLLTEKFGAEYIEYKSKVPAWVPAKVPDLNSMDWPVTFTPALKSEKRTLTAIIAMLIALVLIS